MKKYFIVLFLLFAFCGDNSEQTLQPEAISTDTTEATITVEEESTTTTEIVQLDSFEGTVYEILKDKSKVGYLAPKQFLNSGLETVEGVTSEIIGEFTLELSECDQSDSCLYITNLLIRVDISTLKSNNSIRDSAIKSQWLESKLFPEAVFKIDELVIPNKNFDSKVRQIIKNKNKNELKNKTFLQVSNKNVKIITPTVNKMDESLKSISNTRTNSLEQALKELQNVRKAITG